MSSNDKYRGSSNLCELPYIDTGTESDDMVYKMILTRLTVLWGYSVADNDDDRYGYGNKNITTLRGGRGGADICDKGAAVSMDGKQTPAVTPLGGMTAPYHCWENLI